MRNKKTTKIKKKAQRTREKMMGEVKKKAQSERDSNSENEREGILI